MLTADEQHLKEIIEDGEPNGIQAEVLRDRIEGSREQRHASRGCV